jgi:hypothetical protein
MAICKKCAEPMTAVDKNEVLHTINYKCEKCGWRTIRMDPSLKQPKKRESTAWCECGDALETVTIWKEDPKYGKIIDHWEYYCLGCDKTYILIEKGEINE